ncbi:uncharacterized protein LOC129288716 [Prosopis cineraria]|uniref:uncharacterized protein LOC129288716 n=1 Tax=Prosopis cineraria TaxID=364024 RepID=UPI00240F7CDF|nr:uncharacterized protein LOC129288716 [Prosopis cineraria]
MGVTELVFSIIFFIHLLHSVSSSPVHKTLPSELVQKSKVEDTDVYGGSKIEGGISHGGTGGVKAPNNGDNGNSQGGGAAVIPVYAAGAANNNRQHQNHHGDATCNLKGLELPTLIMVIMGFYTLVQLCLFT